MISKTVYVVGDKFKNFAANENVYIFSDFINWVYKNTYKKIFDYVVLGQGLTENEKKMVVTLAMKAKIGILNNGDIHTANAYITHKHKVKNILITDPKEHLQEKLYKAHLSIDDACAEMSDHTTGQHLQGMVLTEAARQMMLAVAEKYLLLANDKGSAYCALFKMNSVFHKFAFPIETIIKHEILDLKKTAGRYVAKTRTEFYQNSESVCYVDIDYIFSNRAVLLKKEEVLAKQALEENINTNIKKSRYLEVA